MPHPESISSSGRRASTRSVEALADQSAIGDSTRPSARASGDGLRPRDPTPSLR